MIERVSKYWLVLWLAVSLIGAFPTLPHELRRSLQFGYDAFGRPLALLLLKASLLSCIFAFTAVILAAALAFVISAFVSFLPNRGQFAFDRSLEVLLSFPSVLLGLAWAARFGPGWSTLGVALALGTLPPLIRIIRARIKDLQCEQYIEAAYALGAPPSKIVITHYLPALLGLFSVKLPAFFASALLAEASLSFFGLGAPIGRDTWGSLLAQGKDYLLEAPHIAWITGVPLVLTVLALQLLSEHSFEKRVQSSHV